MGLDADFTIHRTWIFPTTGEDAKNPVRDGWPVQEERLHVLTLRKNNRIHAWVCKNVDMDAHECKEVFLDVEQLKELEDVLTAFSKDANALPECTDDVWGSFFGDRDVGPEDQVWAVAYAKRIRAMREYIEKHKSSGYEMGKPWIGGFYKASW